MIYLISLRNAILIVFVFFCLNSNAQVLTQVPGITLKTNFASINESANVAIVGGYRYFKSTDQGNNWIELNSSVGSGLNSFEGYNIAIIDQMTMCIVGKAFNNSSCSVVRTTDGGITWAATLNVPSSLNTTTLSDIANFGSTIVVTTVNGIYRSTDAGNTWTFIQISSAGQVGNFVRYNTASNSWLIGGYSSNFHISTDDALTWTEQAFSMSSSSITGATAHSQGILLSYSTSLLSKASFINNLNNEELITSFSRNLLYLSNSCKTAAFLPDNRLLTHNDYMFYIVDTSFAGVYNIISPAYIGYKPKQFSLASSYGLACANNSSGQGRVYRIDLTQPATLQIHPSFEIDGPGPCAGDTIIATANANYSDSVRWFVNNVYVSTGYSLAYPTPANVFTTYSVKMMQYYNGIPQTNVKDVVMTAPSPPRTFSCVVDTTPCFGEPLIFPIYPTGNNVPNSMLKITYNDQLIFGPVDMTNFTINVTTTPITSNGMLKIITYKSDVCDPSTDTLIYNLVVGPNLFDFNVQPYDSVICAGVNPVLYLDSTNSNYSYDFYTSYSFTNTQSSHTIVQGNSNATIAANLIGTDGYLNDNMQPSTYGSLYMYVNLEITDNAGCSPSRIYDTIRIQRSTAYFELHSRSFNKNDTVNLSNAFVTPGRFWRSEDLNSIYIENETDTIPLIVADTTGFFGIELRNEPVAGCVDSMINFIHYAEQAIEMDSVCNVKKLHRDDFLHRVKMDQSGNLYEIRASKTNFTNVPLYILAKYDHFGNFIWEKRAIDQGWALNDMSAILIEEVDFDDEGNPIIAMWIQGKEPYNDALINFPDPSPNDKSSCFVLKLNKSNGDLVWRTDLSNLLGLGLNTRITDVVEDRNKVHASLYGDNFITFVTLNVDNGSMLYHEDFTPGFFQSIPFISESYQVSTGGLGYGRFSYWSPQIDVLSTGEVVAVGNYQNPVSQSYPQLEMTNASIGTFIMKYQPNIGVYDVQNIGKTIQNRGDIPAMFVDKNDNVTIAGNWGENTYSFPTDPVVQILDSIIPMPSGTFVLNIDTNYNMNWLSLGTNSYLQDIAYSRGTNQTYIATFTKDNFSLGNSESHIMAGIERPYDPIYNSLPNAYATFLNGIANKHFITHLDENGTPVEMKVIDQDTTISYIFPEIKMAASACGDLAIFRGNPGYWQDINGPNYNGDSLFLLLQYASCADILCSYMEAPDSIHCYNGDTIDLQLSHYFNLDTVTFDIVQNGGVIESNQTILASNGKLNVPVQNITPPFEVIFTSPSQDTLFIASPTQVLFGTLNEDSVCVNFGPIQLNGGTPQGGVYVGNGVLGTFFYPASSGQGTHTLSYTYVDQHGCENADNATIYVDECMGVQDAEQYFDIYPNPFTDVLLIENIGMLHAEFILQDQTGRIVSKGELAIGTSSINMNEIATGNYTICILDSNGKTYRYKLLKTN